MARGELADSSVTPWSQNIHPYLNSDSAEDLRHDQFFRFGRLISQQQAGGLD